MPFGFHPLDLVAVLVIALLIFGPKKLPEMGSAIGKSIKEFKKGINELSNPEEGSKKNALRAPKETLDETPVAYTSPADIPAANEAEPKKEKALD